ncbi:MAG: hypothetical protein A2Y38_00830 [Spirochaetes bacterium GWB1_59_5]|nr:MAG: hypothetical protein A2Y38_00830 [Spirochaetes bacterium GWB1_59_5]
MRSLDLLASGLAAGDKPLVVSIVGGGGKTSLLFALASDAAESGFQVLVTTTTRIYDPLDEGRAFDAFRLDEAWAPSTNPIASFSSPVTRVLPLPNETVSSAGRRHEEGFVCVLASGVDSGKLKGIDPALIDAATGWSLILVEADGARHLPLKAPADHEPVIPASSRVVIAVIGLDCLGRPLDDAIAFRPELVARAAGLAMGSIIEPHHLAALASNEAGCFKGTPAGALRVFVLNKLDLTDYDTALTSARAVLDCGSADLVALASLRNLDPTRRIPVLMQRL